MKHVYNDKTKTYELELCVFDKCFTCMYKTDCPLLTELRSERVLIRSQLYKEECSIYGYLPDEEVENFLDKYNH